MIGYRQIRQRIAAKNRRFVRVEMQSQNNKLTRLEDRKRLPIDRLQNEGSYATAFLMDTRNSHLSKAGPCWRLFLIGESRIPHGSFGSQVLLEHCLERTLPTLAKCGNPQCALQLLAGMSWQIQEGVNLGHTDSLWTVSNFYNVIARPNFSFLQHAKVESWSVMCYQQGRHPRFIHADADAVALMLGDGYTVAERGKFEKDAKRALEILFSRSPFKEHRKEFNVWGLCPAAAESGISRPSTGVYRASPLGASYDTFGSERYMMTTNNHALREVASYAPYEFIEILANAGTYGGGGIFNLYATVAIDNQWAPYLFVHEFGHHFAGLADEYYTSDVAYESHAQRIEPWEPNVTALLDPAMLKWKDLVVPGTPVATPWRKAEFEAYGHNIQAERRKLRAENRPESEMNTLFEKEKKHEDELLGTDQYSNRIGAFEGANYEARGYYRSRENCIMFTRYEKFCAVCQRSIERIISLYAAE